MENKTPFDIIQSTENAPFTLNKLSEEFLSIESHFNSILSNLNKEKVEIEKNFDNRVQSINQEKTAIENYTATILTAKKKENKEKLLVDEKDWSNGTYVFNAVSNIIDKLKTKKTIIDVSKWAFVVLGVLDVFDIFNFFNWIASFIDYFYYLN